jgi:protein TonB
MSRHFAYVGVLWLCASVAAQLAKGQSASSSTLAEGSETTPSIAGAIPGGISPAEMNRVAESILRSTPLVVPRIAFPQRARVSSGVMRGLIMKKVNPDYPEQVRRDGTQGTVLLRAIIGKQGDVVEVTIISGDPMLAEAAIKAAKMWKYKPYSLNGTPVEVETQIQMNFTLSN